MKLLVASQSFASPAFPFLSLSSTVATPYSWRACPDCCSCWDASISLWHQSYPVGSITDNCSSIHPLTEHFTLLLVFLLLLSTKNGTTHLCIHSSGHVSAVSSVPRPLTDLQEAWTQHHQASEPNHFAQGCFYLNMSTTSCLNSHKADNSVYLLWAIVRCVWYIHAYTSNSCLFHDCFVFYLAFIYCYMHSQVRKRSSCICACVVATVFWCIYSELR